MADKFTSSLAGLTSPAENIFDIIPDDANDLATATRALNVAQSGTVQVETVGGTTATLFIAAGVAFPVRALRVLATGTAATGIVGMY
ncbi:MAG: spike base protein, RCAP_Rcc01079 family [Cognatishimia sp.]